MRAAVDISQREHQGWTLRESGPRDAEHCLLLLPGGLCTAAFYDEIAAELGLRDAPLRLVAATLPGHGGTKAPEDVSLENYARLASSLRRDLGCDVVVGHSIGANVAIEMACSGEFGGPLVLLSPSFSRRDESKFLRVLDRLATVLGALPFRVMLRLIGPAMSGLKVPDARRAELIVELRRNDPRVIRRVVRAYLRYLDHQDSLAQRLCNSGAPTWLAFGDHGDVGLADDERALLEGCLRVSMVEVAPAGHMTLNEQPGQVADVIIQALTGLRI
jgi:pimeloyl-ACP methyl ester carboxylesterase